MQISKNKDSIAKSKIKYKKLKTHIKNIKMFCSTNRNKIRFLIFGLCF